MNRTPHASVPILLGIEAGGTRTVALAQGEHQVRAEFGPANLRLLNDRQLAAHFRVIARAMPRPAAIAIGMAGARTEADRARIRRAAATAWPRIPCLATNDLETALMAAEELESRVEGRRSRAKPVPRAPRPTPSAPPRVLVLSGTGSCCYGRTDAGQTAKIGGWGHILGDKGSGFEIGLRALKAVVYYFDRDSEWSALGQRLLHALQLNEPDDLIGWVQKADKTAIAALAIEVFHAWARRDAIATDILRGAAGSLARDAVACARRLVPAGRPVRFVLAGSILLKQPRFAQMVGREIQRLRSKAVVTPLRRESAWGAVELARRLGHSQPHSADVGQASSLTVHRASLPRVPSGKPADKMSAPPSIQSRQLSPTELRNPRSMNLDRLSTAEAVALMLAEDKRVLQALLAERKKIEQAVELIVRSFRRGGRLFYLGAGTSGRLGVLDASECPPTFRTDPEMVQGIIAGGQTALWSAVEGAEDDAPAGARVIGFRGVGKRDTVVGIAASGRTPFVWGALREAKRRGANTILLCFNPHLVIPRADRPTLVLVPRIGPEILTGSTRLKAGTATKLVLNIFTTLAMTRLGKVLGNLMIDVKASNTKLRDRAVRIVVELTAASYAAAQAALEKTHWQIKEACARLGQR